MCSLLTSLKGYFRRGMTRTICRYKDISSKNIEHDICFDSWLHLTCFGAHSWPRPRVISGRSWLAKYGKETPGKNSLRMGYHSAKNFDICFLGLDVSLHNDKISYKRSDLTCSQPEHKLSICWLEEVQSRQTKTKREEWLRLTWRG